MTRILAVLLLAAALLTGCAAAASGDGSSAPVDTTQVTMAKSYLFSPRVIRVAPGATVTWTNDDNFTHNVHLTGAGEWQSEPLSPGQSVSHVVSDPGEYRFACTLHPNMNGTIIVAAR